MIIYRENTEVLNLSFNPEGKERCELMVEHSVSITFELSDYVKLEKGDNIIHNGEAFYLHKDYKPTVNKQTGGYKYDLTFYDITERFKDFKIKHSLQEVDELEFKLTTSGDKFLDIVIYSLNKHGLGLFTKGVYPTEIKEIHFQNISIFEALNAIAETYESEWWISDGALNIGKLEFGLSEILREDIELDDISFSQSSEKLITRLYAFGSSRNLPLDYRVTEAQVDNIAERRLRLPDIQYVDLFDNLPDNQIIEGVKVFEDIYPRQKNTIVDVEEHVIQGNSEDTQDTTIFTVKGDNTFTITEDDITSGQPLGIAFQTGYLAGREFDLIIREDNKFEIKYTQDGNVYIPNPTLKPKIGDEFFFFNFKAESVLPNLIASAENELKEAAREFLDKIGSEYVYTCKTRSIKCEKSNIDLQIGQVVTIQSNHLGYITSRVRAFEKDIYNKFDCEYTIGDYSQYSRLSEIEGKIKDSTGSTVYRIGNLDSKYLRKDVEDNAYKLIRFLQGLEVGNYSSGMLGSGGAFKMQDGKSILEVDKLTVRMVATFFELVISKIRHIGGQLILSPARMECTGVEELADGFKCYFNTGDDGEVVNEFVVGDQARCQIFTGSKLKYYWRLVTAVGADYIVLSKTDADGDSVPEVGDDIVQLGNRTDVDRTSAILLSTVGDDAPSIKQYRGINSYSLEGKQITAFTGKGNEIRGKVIFKSNDTDKDLEDFANETEDAIKEVEDKIAPPNWIVEAVNKISGAPMVIARQSKYESMHSITAVAKITRDGEDVTELMKQSPERLYQFQRVNLYHVDDKGLNDSEWNQINLNKTEVTLTHLDIMFVGNLVMVYDTELLETEYQKIIKQNGN